MKKFLKNQRAAVTVKIIAAILLGLFVLMAGAFIQSLDGLPQLVRSNHTTMLLFSFFGHTGVKQGQDFNLWF